MAVKAATLSSEKEALILAAAHKRFTVYGLGKVTMDEIAADVGMGKASLYYYFPTKDHLFCSVIAREQVTFMQHLEAVLRLEIPAADKLRRYIEQRLAYMRTLLSFQIMHTGYYHNPKPLIRDLFESFAADEHRCLAEILRDGKRKGELDLRSPEAIATLLLHVLQGLRLRTARASMLANVSDEEAGELTREIDRKSVV